MDKMQFKVQYCGLCKSDMIICPKCGNNCCNGGYGEVNGKKCDVCPLAYQYQTLYGEREIDVLATFFLQDNIIDIPYGTIENFFDTPEWQYWENKLDPNTDHKEDIKTQFYKLWNPDEVKGRFVTIEVGIGHLDQHKKYNCAEYYVVVRKNKDKPIKKDPLTPLSRPLTEDNQLFLNIFGEDRLMEEARADNINSERESDD